MKIFLLNYHNNGLNIQVPVLGSAALGVVAMLLRDKLSPRTYHPVVEPLRLVRDIITTKWYCLLMD